LKTYVGKSETLAVEVLQRLVTLNRGAKVALMMLLDAFLCVAAAIIAFSLRLGVWDLWNEAIERVIIACLVLWFPVFLLRGIYNSVVRFMGSRTMIGIVVSCIAMMVGLVLLFTFNTVPGVPRTIAMIQPMAFAALLMTSRLFARYVFFDLLNRRSFSGRRQISLIYGAGSAGRQLAVSLRHEPGFLLQGYLDDDERLEGKRLDGVKVFGGDRAAELVERLAIDVVILAVPSVSRQQRDKIIRKFESISVRVLLLPKMGDFLNGSVSLRDLRDIEITDLLGRDPVAPNHLLLHRTISSNSVMITGAGGSIGSELCRQISQLQPARMILVEMTEHALYSIEAELREMQRDDTISGSIEIHAELANVTDPHTVRRLFERWRPDTVFHAAAYKHVPLVEENVISGMRNNIFGTLYCALEAERLNVRNFILVSTDKAVRPSNVMGASKRVCELVLQGLAARQKKTRFAIVRFGNVLGSSGSVVPRFQQQIRSGGPVTLTHRDVTRYFMTIPEAAQLVIQACGMAEGGEVYVLDMGEPIKIYDLARTMIHLSGLTLRDASHPDGDIEICEIGLRRGEKLYEELLIGSAPKPTHHPRIMHARERHLGWEELSVVIEELNVSLQLGDRERSLELLSRLVPEFAGEQAQRRPSAA
jgi:FlaA1/EpsC-like NDP-sugar epimerase